MNFNVDRIAQLAGLSSAGGNSGSLNESASRRPRASTTYDRVVEELQVRGLEMFYSPEQINESIRSERRLIAEEREMTREGSCPSCHKSPCMCDESYDMGDMDEAEEHLKQAEDEMYAEDESYAVGTKISEPDGTQYQVTKSSGKSGGMAETKLRRVISSEVDRVLAEMNNSGDTAWMYADRKRPTNKGRGATMSFPGIGFKR